MESSIKVTPKMPTTFNEFTGYMAPRDESCVAQLQSVHPLKQSEQNYAQHSHNLNMQMLRKREGLAAPLKLTMELKAVSKVGHLPFLPSTNVARDVLTGRDEMIEFSDIYNTEEHQEIMRQPHAVMEKTLGIH
ncbi:proteasome maturation protein-like [Anopheles cruzii]|uniref:proteasome maturation protein-like n=1 Tax=Anopheles cruzii TaxID=68878 RepID=UPI0022EC246E|nr:proteasome maturation protein-like [Anopheles cruzii]XP_052871192.1 proteasome maturation protein-like [Anopheles cruzii]XP_052871194.1 proteasome maturation protein-like [Anopheles cruzii]XP_052871196.1 proteasome maturation protein-like [Anopheles cruzii]XP_052871199.1 proteasome maturation protein-like [Anopheles cruzii]XP_052871201.1 proteasome maturation protein-like [Anopheles cruzii]